jgi:hypothetical protein
LFRHRKSSVVVAALCRRLRIKWSLASAEMQGLTRNRKPSLLTLSIAGLLVLAVAALAAIWPAGAAAQLAAPSHRAGRALAPASAVVADAGTGSQIAGHPAVTFESLAQLDAIKAAGHLAAVKSATAAARRAAARRRRAASVTSPAPVQVPAPVEVAADSTGSPQQIAMSMLGSYGWASDQFACLDALWNAESGWNVYATNAGSGAYGIPQALPGSKMASAGADWQTDPATQIRWGLGYIQATYGSPCGAWGHEEAYGWY